MLGLDFYRLFKVKAFNVSGIGRVDIYIPRVAIELFLIDVSGCHDVTVSFVGGDREVIVGIGVIYPLSQNDFLMSEPKKTNSNHLSSLQ